MTKDDSTQTKDDRAPAQSRPEDVLRDGNLKASIWRNEGERGDYFATTFARTQKDQDGNLRDAHSFVGSDLLKLSELARKSYERTNELRREDFQERRSSRPTERGRSR
tara:strand:- start:2066 stop:2389 length:324 start_codon:yes stop_codon:yes gene_type:complete